MHKSGMIGFPFEGTPQQSLMHGHPLTPQHPAYPAGIHPVKVQEFDSISCAVLPVPSILSMLQGYKSHPPGAYIELRHTNDSDPATRRQNILRIGNAAMAETSTTQSQLPAKDTSSASTSSPVQIKVNMLPGTHCIHGVGCTCSL